MKQIGKSVLPPMVADIILAKEGVLIRDMSEVEIITEIVKIYGEMYADLGWNNVESEDQLLMSTRLTKNYLMKYFTTLTIQEVRLVCINGIGGFYGDVSTIAPASIAKWLNKFVASSDREKANKETRKSLPMKTDFTVEEKKRLVHEGALKSFEEFKEKKYIYDSGNVTYNYLKSRGIINFTKERTDKMYLEAKAELISAKKQSRGSVKEFSIIGDINRAISDLEGGKRKEEILIEAKRKALNIFFAELVETETDLTELLT